MRREIFRLERVEGGDQVRRPFRLLCLCQYCAHAATPRNEAGKEYCTQGLELPQYGGFCAGFTRARKTGGNKETLKATNGLPSHEACDIMGAPNQVRRHKSLSGFPRAGKILVILHLLSTPARKLARRLHILAGLQCPGTREGPAASLEPGSITDLPFLFPKSSEVFNV